MKVKLQQFVTASYPVIFSMMAAVACGQDRAEISETPVPSTPVVADPQAAPVAQPVVRPAPPVSGSLFMVGQPGPATPDGQVTSQLAATNLMSVTPAQPKKFERHKLITVVVREDSQYQSSGTLNSKKTQTFDAALTQMLQLNLNKSGTPNVGKVGNPSQLPEVAFNYNNDRKNDATNERTDSFTVRIQAEIVDVKPNGNLSIEATKTIQQDKEVQIFKLTGECASSDVQADNSVLSTQVANLSISKTTAGEVRDGTKSGWMNRFIDKANPF